MSIIAQFAITLGAWIVLSILCTNLIGFFVRGLFISPEMDSLLREGHEIIEKEIVRGEIFGTFIPATLLIIFLMILYYLLNLGVAIVALLIMLLRIPDLVWEIKNGKSKTSKQPPIYTLIGIGFWGSLPALWYALYKM